MADHRIVIPVQKSVSVIRRMVYAAGFRPKMGTVLHSPSLHLLATYKKARAGLNQSMFLPGSSTLRLRKKRDKKVLVGSNFFVLMQNCVICGAALDFLVMDIKECPEGHGKFFPSHNDKGLPVITFEPYSERD